MEFRSVTPDDYEAVRLLLAEAGRQRRVGAEFRRKVGFRRSEVASERVRS
ncbi:MAG TPA: hypothetical protein VF754_07730 [Pyrinomonadaceae bacterium]